MNLQIIDLHQDYVRASLEDNVLGDNILTEECRIQTGLDDDLIRAAQPIEQVLDEVNIINDFAKDPNEL